LLLFAAAVHVTAPDSVSLFEALSVQGVDILQKKPAPKKATTIAKTSRRRDEYAEETRRAILAAARELFSQRGYFSTTVDDIAKRARVASITVYVSAGGKSGLLRTLTDEWSAAPLIESNYKVIRDLQNPVEILGIVASTAREIREEFGDIVILMLATAPHDKDVSESLSLATSRYRQAIQAVVKHLIDLDALREEFDETYALDVLWFYFGYWGLYSLHNENGWTYEKAERWLCEAATSALLRVRHPTKPSPAHELDV